ncbi:MAG: HDOD domain-containing protein [Syntrophales bacterium]|nr:HDOD domain-containing protein [Syntrophales bacterium]
MKILVVDDEIVSRKKMEKIMSSFGECAAVDSGPAALREFEAAIDAGEPFNLIALDISMPEMDGTEVLYRLKVLQQEKNIPIEHMPIIIIVTAQSDRDTVVTCIQAGCDSYIVKPFDRNIIASKLEELGVSIPKTYTEGQTIRKMVMETIRKFKQGKVSLPVLPQIIKEIEDAMASPSMCADDLADILERDAVISIKIITTANSPLYFRGGEKIRDLKTAVLRIGTKEIQDIVSTIATRGLYESKSMEFNELLKRLWMHSLASAYACREISTGMGDRDGRVFLMGLTHELGCALLLKSIGDIVPATMAFSRDELMESLHEVHVSFGAALLDQWGFGGDFSEVVKRHKWASFEKDTKKEVLIVNLAENIANRIDCGFFENDADLSNLESARLLGINMPQIEKTCSKLTEVMKEAEKVFY